MGVISCLKCFLLFSVLFFLFLFCLLQDFLFSFLSTDFSFSKASIFFFQKKKKKGQEAVVLMIKSYETTKNQASMSMFPVSCDLSNSLKDLGLDPLKTTDFNVKN